MRPLAVLTLNLAFSTTTVMAQPAADASAARQVAEQAEREAKDTKDPGKYIACGDAYLAANQAGPTAPGADELYYNAAICYELGGAVSTALRLYAEVHRHARSPLAARALARLARLSADAGLIEEAATHLERYAKQYTAEKDAYDALSDAVYYRTALGDTAKQIELTKTFVKLFGNKKPLEAASAMFSLTAAYQTDRDAQIKHLKLLLRTHGNKLGEREAIVRYQLGALLWEASCPSKPVDGLCVKIERPRTKAAMKARCSSTIQNRWIRVSRSAARAKEATQMLNSVAKAAAKHAQQPAAQHALGMARVALADASLEEMIGRAYPTGLDFTPGTKANTRSLQRFQTWVSDMTADGGRATRLYEDVLALKDGTSSVAAAARLGQTPQVFARAMLTADVPASVRRGANAADKRAAFCDALGEAAAPLVDRATVAFGVCVQKSTELGISNTTTRMCRSEIAGADPSRAMPAGLPRPSITMLPAMLAPPLALRSDHPTELARALASFVDGSKKPRSVKTCQAVAEAFIAAGRKHATFAGDAWFMAGLQRHRCGELADARRAYETARKAVADHPRATANLAALAWSDGQHDAAQRLWTAALARDNRLAAAHAGLALDGWRRARANAKDRKLAEEAQRHAMSAMALDKGGEAGVVLGAMLSDQPKKHGLARMYADHALRADDSIVSAHLLRGVLAARRDEWSLALSHLERAVELAPRLPAALEALGIAQVHVGRFEAARTTLGKLASPRGDALVARDALRRLDKPTTP